MTGTEMFDAIAHIDEDLIEGCLSRMTARSSERRAHAEKAEPGDENKTSERRRTVLAFAALSAAIVLVIGFVSIMHIGRESPKPIDPISADSPAPTEAGNEDGKSPFRYSVSVVLDNEESLKFKEYGPEDFPGIDCTEVVNVTEALETSIRALVESGVQNSDVQEFCKSLRIMLSDPSEENAKACAAKLRGIEHVISAEPCLEPYEVLINGFRCRIEDTILPVEGRIQVADRVFLYPSDFHIILTNEEDGRIYDLPLAYANGLISYDDLSELYFIHMEYVIRKGYESEETYKKEAFVHYAFIDHCEIGFSHEETGGVEVKEVAGSKFIFAHPFTIVVRKMDEEDILDITEAYEAGLLTAEDVAEAARLHRGFVISTFDFGAGLYDGLSTVPEGYNEHDYNALRAFLETESDGRKNGERLNSGYDPDRPATWTFVRWDETQELAKWDEDGYLVRVFAMVEGYALAGELDLSGCERLDVFEFSSESISGIDLTGCPLRRVVTLQNSSITRLLPDPIVTPKLNVSNAGLSRLHWIAVPDEKVNGNYYDFELELLTEGEGSVGTILPQSVSAPEVTIHAIAAKGWHFTGWYDAEGALVSKYEAIDLAGFCDLPREGRITGSFCFTARFEEGSFVTEVISNSEAYTDAVIRLMNGEAVDGSVWDSVWDMDSCDVYFHLDDDALRAYARVIVPLVGAYLYEYLDPIAEYPREVGEAALQRLYLEVPKECGFESLYHSVGDTAEGFAGKDWFMLKTVDDTIQDIQFHCIFVKAADGSWHEIDANDKQMHTLVYGALMLNEKEGYISYGGKNLDEPDGSYRRICLFRTDDGGRTWKDVGLVIPEEYGRPYPGCVLSPVFDGDHGAMLVIASRLDVPESTPWEETRLTLWYETFDGGRTWTLHDEKES